MKGKDILRKQQKQQPQTLKQCFLSSKEGRWIPLNYVPEVITIGYKK